jgi:hypothetical protein
MLQLALRTTTFDDGPRRDDFAVIWTSDEFGARRVGRIRLAGEHDGGERWEWAINPPMPVPAWGHGLARSRPMATAAFRRVFERLHSETTTRQWQDAFATQRIGEERLEVRQGKKP